MNTFPCSSCKSPIHAADDLVGKSILCPHCGLATTVANAAITTTSSLPTYPSSTGVTTADVVEAAEQARRRRDADERYQEPDLRNPNAWLGRVIPIFLAVSAMAILLGLLIPAVAKVREAAARTQSINNLKNIGLSVHSFHDVNKHLPFNGSDLPFKEIAYRAEAGTSNSKSGSWAFQIMPYISQDPLYNGALGDNVDLREGLPFNTPFPANLRTIGLPYFMCPGRGRPSFEDQGGPWTDYFYNNYLNDPKQASKPDAAIVPRTLIGITDGSSNTVLVGHGNVSTEQYARNTNVKLSTNIFRGGTAGTMRAGNNGETAPGGVTLQRDSVNLPTIGSWGGPFSQGALMGMADGTVRMYPYNMQNFGEFLTPSGGEAVTLCDT